MLMKRAPTISFSASMRKQMLTIDLVRAVISGVRGVDGKPLLKKTKNAVQRINNRVESIQRLLFNGAPGPTMRTKDLRRYERMIEKCKQIVQHRYPEEGVPTNDFFNAVLLLVSDRAKAQVENGKNKELINHWKYLSQTLNTLYRHADPELDDIRSMILGEELARQLRSAIDA